MANLAWPSGSFAIDSEASLTEHLARLHRQYKTQPTMIELTLDDGESLSVGVGLEWSVLSHVLAHHDPPYHSSVGDHEALGSLWFDYFGSPSEFPMTNAVRTDDAFDAMRQFLRSGGLPENVPWEEV